MGSPLIRNAAALLLKASYFLFLSLLYISGSVVDTRLVCVYGGTVLHSARPDLIRHH